MLQGERAGHVFAVHRLKSLWQLETRNVKLDAARLTSSLYSRLAVTSLGSAGLTNWSGQPSQFPEAGFKATSGTTIDQWSTGEPSDRRRCELITSFTSTVPGNECPLQVLGDGTMLLKVTYVQPQPFLDGGNPSRTSTEEVLLRPVEKVSSRSIPQTRTISVRGINVTSRFYWPPYPNYPTAGYTAPLIAWIETTITGLASKPIVLHHEFSQSYKPGHHNFYEEFLFEPGLEPGLDPEIARELRDQNIRALYLVSDIDGSSRGMIWGCDDQLRNP